MQKIPTKSILVISLFFIFYFAKAQETVNNKYIDKKGRLIRYNIIKTNLVGWPLGMFNIAYERKLNKTFSALVELNVFGQPFVSNFTQNDSAQQTTNLSINASGFALSPELRWYLGKNGSPRGYYLGIYLPIINYNSKIEISAKEKQTINDNSGGFSQNIDINTNGSFSPNISFYGLGLSGGPQFLIGNRISLEFYLNLAIGSYSVSNKNITQTGSASLLLPTAFSNISSGNYTASELANLGLKVDSSLDYTYQIENNGNENVLIANYSKTEINEDLKDLNNGIIVLPRIGFSIGYAFGK